MKSLFNYPIFIVLTAGAIPALAQEVKEPAYEDRVAAALEPVPGGLTADEAARRAVVRAPDVAAREAEIELAKAGQARTLSRYVPAVTVTASVTRTNLIDFDFSGAALSVGALNPGALTVGACPDGSGDNCVLDGAGQPVGAAAPQPFEIPRNNYAVTGAARIPISDYLLAMPSARRASAADLRAAHLRRDASTEQVALDARVAFYEWLRAKAQIAVAEQSLASALARLEDAKIGLASGTLAPADILQIESLEASSRVTLVNAQSFEQVARANLAVLLEVDPASLTIGEDIRGDMSISAVTLEAALATARKRRAELRAFDESVYSAEEAAYGARSELYPRLEAVGNVTHANPNQSFFPPEAVWNTSWSIGLQLSWSLDRFFAGRAQVKELEANGRLFQAQRAGVARGITLEVTAAWQALQRAAAAVRLSRVDVAAAEGAYSQRVALYQVGEATTTEVLDAELARFNASLRSIDARIDLRIARAQLDRAIGRDRPEGPRR